MKSSKKTNYANNKKYTGRIVEVLVDKIEPLTSLGSKSPIGLLEPKKDQKETLKYIYFGHTRTMKNIKLVSKKPVKVGSLVKTKVTKANVWNLEGKIT